MYYRFDSIIKKEIDNGQRIALYPFGKCGLTAKEIITDRYGCEPIIIDNRLAEYNPSIYDVGEFKKMDSSDISIIITTPKQNLNRELTEKITEGGLLAKIINPWGPVISRNDKQKDYFEKIKEFCCIKKVVGYDLIRIGKKNDGGYVMLDDFKKKSIAYSFGIADDTSWDEEVAERDIDIYCYDPSIKCLPVQHERLHFEEFGIAGKDKMEDKLLSMESILKRNGHENGDNMILKMDVEGAEWEFIENIPKSVLEKFSMISFELHGMLVDSLNDKILSALEKLNDTHQAIWVHGNNNGNVGVAGDILMPSFLEITYVSRNKYEFEEIKYDCPISLDQVNIPGKWEIELKNWGDKSI